MQKTELFVDLILPIPLPQLFSYSVPELYHQDCLPGKRAVVQFGKKKIYSAIIRNVHQNKPEGFQVKDILEIIDKEPIVSEKQFQFWEWMAEYYMCSIGEIYKAALPAGLRLESNTNISYNHDFFEETTENKPNFSNKEINILNALHANKSLTINEISTIAQVKNIVQTIKSLHEKGAILVEESLERGFQAKTEKYIKLKPEHANDNSLNLIIKKLERAGKQLELLTTFLSISEFEEGKELQLVKRKVLLRKCEASPAILDNLIKKGILESIDQEISRLEFINSKGENKLNELNPEQTIAYNQLCNQFENKDTILLHGVTSSGKTEIYIKLINNYLQKGKQVLYMLPEIALTAQMVDRLRKAFGQKVGVYHSKYNDEERVETWNNISGRTNHHSPAYQIILGVRSSVFLPFTNLGLIIIDEEHENTYKQYNPAPRYQARDAALMLARLQGAKTLLGSATPSIESYFNSKTSKFGFVELKNRFQDIQMPEILIANVKEARRKKQMKSHFTPVLLDSIQQALDQKKQVILFQNRRGFAPYLECFECGWIPKCEHCDVSLTYHQHNNQLVCHYCGFSLTSATKCGNCNCTDIRTRGFGTEKIEEELKLFYPEAAIKRMDLDTAKGKKAHSQLIADIENQKVDIIVGTQMISKGLDFENVSLVGILDANQMLNYPDFRAYERSYQLMAQVGGRAGRKNKRGTVIVQTTSPENPIIQYVLQNDFENMFKEQVSERKQFKYPPFYRLISITIKHKDKIVLDQAAEIFAKSMKKVMHENVIGPEYPIISKTFDQYLKSILIKIDNPKLANSFKKYIIDTASKLCSVEKFKAVQMVFDVDPY